jgi:hypothetical protein
VYKLRLKRIFVLTADYLVVGVAVEKHIKQHERQNIRKAHKFNPRITKLYYKQCEIQRDEKHYVGKDYLCQCAPVEYRDYKAQKRIEHTKYKIYIKPSCEYHRGVRPVVNQSFVYDCGMDKDCNAYREYLDYDNLSYRQLSLI